VQRIDPVTGKTTASVFLGASAVAFWKGSAWVLSQQRSFTFLRIDPATNRVTGKPVTVGKPVAWYADPTAIAVGPTGLWVLDFYRNLLFHIAIKPVKP
jgi:DNA-binding beta-propeller fold protein YncE